MWNECTILYTCDKMIMFTHVLFYHNWTKSTCVNNHDVTCGITLSRVESFVTCEVNAHHSLPFKYFCEFVFNNLKNLKNHFTLSYLQPLGKWWKQRHLLVCNPSSQFSPPSVRLRFSNSINNTSLIISLWRPFTWTVLICLLPFKQPNNEYNNKYCLEQVKAII